MTCFLPKFSIDRKVKKQKTPPWYRDGAKDLQAYLSPWLAGQIKHKYPLTPVLQGNVVLLLWTQMFASFLNCHSILSSLLLLLESCSSSEKGEAIQLQRVSSKNTPLPCSLWSHIVSQPE